MNSGLNIYTNLEKNTNIILCGCKLLISFKLETMTILQKHIGLAKDNLVHIVVAKNDVGNGTEDEDGE